MDCLIVGKGLLGAEIRGQTGWDLCKYPLPPLSLTTYSCLINCIGYTKTYDNDKSKHWKSNLQITKELIDHCNYKGYKYVHISTDYLYSGSKSFASEEDVPVHNNCWYTYTKLLADGLVQLESDNYLICRGTHKPFPFPYKDAWTDQVGNFDYVHIIAKLIIKLIEKGATGVYNVGTGLKTMAELAGDKVGRIMKDPQAPGDVTMNIDKLKNFLK